MSEHPLVTVITATLNSASTIAECINSVASQDYSNIEHIIIDGVSTDGTLEILRSFGADFISEQDSGIYHAFNKGIARSSGQIIHFLNADDYYKHASVVSNMIKFMMENQLQVGHARVEQVDEQLQLVL